MQIPRSGQGILTRLLRRCLPVVWVGLALALAMGLGGCSKLPPWRSFFGGRFHLDVSVGQGINQNSPVPVEVLIVYDGALWKSISTMSASAWFAGRTQFLLDHPAGSGYQNQMWQWVPGQTVPPQRLEYRPGVNGAVVFAGYFSPGDHRAIFLPFRDYALTLGLTDFTLVQR
ncbi:MAG TPA: hypothetical protein VN783_14465 [Thermoanaerobaculia bacterium]|nr:hypothetical protein [Thermoanaerobaculia bacterium]